MARKAKPPLSLPAMADTWYCTVRRVDTWVASDSDSERYFRPFVLTVFQLGSGLVVATQILEAKPSLGELQRELFSAMRRPSVSSRVRPHRPGAIAFGDESLARTMAPLLAAARVQARYMAPPEEVEEALAGLVSALAGPRDDALSGLLDRGDSTPEQVGEFFHAAAAFYRAEPWIRLSNDDVLSVQVLPGRKRWLVVVMGQGGQEYGLSLFKDRDEIEQFIGDPEAIAGSTPAGRHALMFNEPPYLSFSDLDAIERYGWELPEPGLYPTPMIFKQRSVSRPDAAMLRWYEAALRAIPLFVEHYLRPGPGGELAPADAEITVSSGAAETVVRLSYPAADTRHIVPHPLPEPGGEHGPELSFEHGRRMIERQLAAATASMGAHSQVSPAVAEAQELIYVAWEERLPARRVALARQALTVSPDCADAYVILAEDEAETREEALAYYRAGVEAGRRALGEACFLDPEIAGHFWAVLETRPYMRALEGLASVQERLGRTNEAIAHYRELLRLNPGDNQGIRYVLLRLLVRLDRDDEAKALLEEYEHDWSADWQYTSALLAFRREPGPRADEALKAALRMNAHVPAYITGKKRIPGRLPDRFTPGEDSEAAVYGEAWLSEWRKTSGAVGWLRRLADGR